MSARLKADPEDIGAGLVGLRQASDTAGRFLYSGIRR